MRGQFIPVRKTDIVDALTAPGGPAPNAAGEFADFCRLLALTLHYEYFDELDRLKHAYFHFDPMVAGEVATPPDGARAALVASLEDVLVRANFVEVSREEIERASHEHGVVPVAVRSPLEDYHDIRFFRRGQRCETIVERDWLRRRRPAREAVVYDDVVLLAEAKSGAMEKAGRRHRRARKAAHGAVLVKYFHDIASADLDTLLPDVRVVMNGRDRWLLGVPAVFGGIPLALKLAPTLAVLLVLAGVQLGSSGNVEADHLKQALAVLSGLVALGSFGAHQWLKYQRTALRYQVAIKDNLYFRNVNNNSGVFDALVGAAEDQDFKEALLAYVFLATGPCDEAALDRRIEAWLHAKFAVDVDFEVDDGLGKLERYGLLLREGDRLSVVPTAEALARLDGRWDNYFTFHEPLTAGAV